jgi:hypothetical protein
MNDIKALEHELIGLAKERKVAFQRGDAVKTGFIDDVIANRQWWLQHLKAEKKATAKEG